MHWVWTAVTLHLADYQLQVDLGGRSLSKEECWSVNSTISQAKRALLCSFKNIFYGHYRVNENLNDVCMHSSLRSNIVGDNNCWIRRSNWSFTEAMQTSSVCWLRFHSSFQHSKHLWNSMVLCIWWNYYWKMYLLSAKFLNKLMCLKPERFPLLGHG